MAAYTAQEAEAILKPHLQKYLHAVDNEIWDEVEGFYHKNGVLVHKDKESTYGNKAITEVLRNFANTFGKSVATISAEKFEGTGDYFIITADFSSKTEKAGVVQGKFVQIWKKEGEKFYVYHDEFEIIA